MSWLVGGFVGSVGRLVGSVGWFVGWLVGREAGGTKQLQICNRKRKKEEEVKKVMKDKRDEIASEIADIMHFIIAFSNATGIDLYKEFMKKLEHNNQRYPKELVKGKSHKYTYYQREKRKKG